MRGAPSLETLAEAAAHAGLSLRGAFHAKAGDGVPANADGQPIGTLVLLGWIGGRQWPAFAHSPEMRDGEAHPLDRWSARVIGDLARRFDACALYPFGGPPYLPFQRWAHKGDDVFPSPLGLFIHARYGLWHSYRGALGFARRLVLPERETVGNPCDACAAKPCLTRCPVSAFQPGRYDVAGCASHVKSAQGTACRDIGCQARLACPLAPQLAYGPEQAAFYMRAFTAAH